MSHPDSLGRDRAWPAHGNCAEGVDFHYEVMIGGGPGRWE